MAENKTKPTGKSVVEFIEAVEPEQKRKDAFILLDLFRELTGEEAVLWGPSLIGYGKYKYTYASGHGGEFFVAGFSPRKTALTVYIMSGFSKHDELMAKLGKFKTGKSCLYIKKLEDVDMEVLKTLILESVRFVKEKYPD